MVATVPEKDRNGISDNGVAAAFLGFSGYNGYDYDYDWVSTTISKQVNTILESSTKCITLEQQLSAGLSFVETFF